MKRIYLLVALLGFFSHSSAQKFYNSLSVGYGLKSSSSEVGVNGNLRYTDDELTSGTIESIRSSFGQGVILTYEWGAFVNENIGFDFSFSYLMGSHIKTNRKETYSYTNGSPNARVTTIDEDYRGSMGFVTPSLVLGSKVGAVSCYGKIGLLFGFGSLKNHVSLKTTMTQSGIKENLSYDEKYYGGVSTGLKSNIGIDIPLDDDFSFFVEGSIRSINYVPTKLEITVPGNSLTYNLNKKSDFSPDAWPQRVLPFGSWGINVGIRLYRGHM